MTHTPFITELSDDDIRQLGVTSFGYIHTKDIIFSKEVRRICEGNQCGNYGKTWACPPAVGTVEECREKCLQYSSAFVFASVYTLEDSFDYEGMMRGHRQFKKVCDRIFEHLRQPFLLLSNEGCVRCRKCTYPEETCRFPDKLFPALEGYGIFVNKLAQTAGIPYIAGANTVTYFGMVCFD